MGLWSPILSFTSILLSCDMRQTLCIILKSCINQTDSESFGKSSMFVQLQEDLCNSLLHVLHPWLISEQYLLLTLQLKLLSKLDFWRAKWRTTPKYWSQVSFVLEIPLMSWKSDESLLYFITSWCLKALRASLKRARVCFCSREVSSHYCWHVAAFWLDLRRQNTMA